MPPHPFERVLAPRAVAVFGAGDEHFGRDRAVAGTLTGVRWHESLASVEGPVDLAVVATPPAKTASVLRACAERGVAGAVVPAGVSPEAHRERVPSVCLIEKALV